MKCIVYKTTDTFSDKIYIGVDTKNDDLYFGSGNAIKEIIKERGTEYLIKETLYEFDTPEEAFLKEAEIVTDEFRKRDNVLNIALGGARGLYAIGLIAVHDDDNLGKYKSITTEEYKKGGYRSVASGRCRAILLSTGEIINTVTDDYRWETGEICGLTKGKNIGILVSTGEKIWVDCDDIRWKNKEIIGITAGRKRIIHKELNLRTTVKINELEYYFSKGWELGSGTYKKNKWSKY